MQSESKIVNILNTIKINGCFKQGNCGVGLLLFLIIRFLHMSAHPYVHLLHMCNRANKQFA